MKIDLALVEGGLEAARTGGRTARAAGFGCVWTTETTSDPFLQALAALDSGGTAIGTAIAVSFARTPMATAYPAWDLALASQGRFTLGLGSQVKAHIERRFGMPWGAPVERMKDYVAALRAIWECWRTGEGLAYEGLFYRHSLMTPVFRPESHSHPIRIGIAGVGPRMTALAGEVADVLLVHGLSNVEYIDTVTTPALAKGLRRAGRQRSDVEVYSTTFMLMGDTDAEIERQREDARGRLAFYASTPSYQPVLAAIGHGDLQPELNTLARAGDWGEMSRLLDDSILDSFSVSGRPEEMPGLLKRRFGDRFDRVSSYYGWPPLEPDRLADIVKAFND